MDELRHDVQDTARSSSAMQPSEACQQRNSWMMLEVLAASHACRHYLHHLPLCLLKQSTLWIQLRVSHMPVISDEERTVVEGTSISNLQIFCCKKLVLTDLPLRFLHSFSRRFWPHQLVAFDQQNTRNTIIYCMLSFRMFNDFWKSSCFYYVLFFLKQFQAAPAYIGIDLEWSDPQLEPSADQFTWLSLEAMALMPQGQSRSSR